MAKFYGKVGFGIALETSSGIFEETMVEYGYYGDVIQTIRKLDSADKVLDNMSIQNVISIVGDQFIYSNISQIRYVVWMGTRWNVPYVEVKRPRLILRPSTVYTGPLPRPVDSFD